MSKYCTYCVTKLNNNDRFCANCGKPRIVNESRRQVAPMSDVILRNLAVGDMVLYEKERYKFIGFETKDIERIGLLKDDKSRLKRWLSYSENKHLITPYCGESEKTGWQGVKRFNENNYNKSFIGKNHTKEITAKFILLHIISHLLIKALSFECGYSVTSLSERLYCSDEEEKQMAGILIYTASGDSEGTLGGLVRQGKPDTFPKIFKKAINSAIRCSNDPICILNKGQGRDSLNLAACRAFFNKRSLLKNRKNRIDFT